MEDFEEIRDALLRALEALVTRHVNKIADASRESAERVARQLERIDALERELQGISAALDISGLTETGGRQARIAELVEMARDTKLAIGRAEKAERAARILEDRAEKAERDLAEARRENEQALAVAKAAGEQHAAAVSASFDAGWSNGRLALQRDVDEKLERAHVRVQVAEAAVEGLGKESRQLAEELAKVTEERDAASGRLYELRVEADSASDRLCAAIEWPREGMALTGCVDIILDALNERGRQLRLKTDSSEWLRNAVVELGRLVGAGDHVATGERYPDSVVRICKERLAESDRLRSDLETVRKFAQGQVVQYQDEVRELQAEIRKRDDELVTSRTETKRVRADLAAEMQAHFETKAKLADVEGRLPGVEMDSSVEAKALTPQEDGRWSRGIWIPGGQAQDEIFAKDAMDAASSDGVVPRLAAIALDGLAMVPAELRDAKHRKLCDDLAKAAGWPIETCRLEGMATEPDRGLDAKIESLARNAEAASQAILAMEKRLAALESIGGRPV